MQKGRRSWFSMYIGSIISIPTATPMISTPRPLEDKDKAGSSSSISSTASDSKATVNGHVPSGEGGGDKPDGGVSQSGSMKARNKSTIMYDKLLEHEIKDLLVCFLYVVKNVTDGE